MLVMIFFMQPWRLARIGGCVVQEQGQGVSIDSNTSADVGGWCNES